jgi:RHS repeat-associated protein
MASATYHYDAVSRKFTGKERDYESNLDNFGARFDASSLGRFMTPDETGLDQQPDDPKSWNLYSYVRNNPLALVDPTGQYVCGSTLTYQQCDQFSQSLTAAQAAADAFKAKYGENNTQYQDAQKAIDAYGAKNVDNGVTIQLGSVAQGAAADTTVGGNLSQKTLDNPNGQNIVVTFDPGAFGKMAGTAALAITSAHEGSHVADGSDWVTSGFSRSMNPTEYQTEQRAFGVSAAIAEGSGAYPNGLSFGGTSIWQPGWPQAQIKQGIDKMLAVPTSAGGLYGYTPAHQGGRAFSKLTKVHRVNP